MNKSIMNPPEREQYFAGAIAQLVKAGVRKGTAAYKKLDKKTKEALDKAQGITEDTPGATAKGRGAVVGKERTKAFEKSAQTTGRLEGLGSAAALTTLGTGISSLLNGDKDSKVSYAIEDLPREGAIITTETKSGTTTYSNSGFKRAAQKAAKEEKDEFAFDGDSYNVVGALEALDRFKMNEGGEFDPVKGYIDMYRTFERSLAAAESNEQRETIKKNFIKDTSNVSDMTKIAAMKEIDKELMAREGKAKGGKFPDLTGDGEVTQADVLKGRGVFNEGGSMLMPTEGMPVDTYSNIPDDEMDEAMASQLPDDDMEEDYIKYVMDESLDDEEQMYLAGVLQDDSRLSDILDKVITVASEFSGAGEVDGPGTGVSDSIPARLSDGEFVFTRKATDQIGADNLQVMMDDAERAYDGGLQREDMAIGGMAQDEEDLSSLSKTDEEIKKLMMGANKMPSLR
jgi:hypothetical protein